MTKFVKLSDRLVETALDDEIVLMRLDNGEFFALNGTAVAVWRRIDDMGDVDALIDAVAGEYRAPAGEIEADVTALLAQLVEFGVLARN